MARSRPWVGLLIAVLIASACSAVQWARKPGVFVGGRVVVVDPDDFVRFARLRIMVETGAWRLDTMTDIGPPGGVRMHWTWPNDALLRAAFALFGGDGSQHAMAAVSVWVPVALGWLALVITFLGLRAAVGTGIAVVGTVLAGVSQTHQLVFALGHPDHHALLQLLLTASLMALLVGANSKRAGVWMLLSGVAMGVAIWVVVQAVAFWAVFGAAIAGAAVLGRGNASRAFALRAGVWWSVGVFIAVLIGHLVENAPHVFYRIGDMISLSYVLLTGLSAAAFVVAARVGVKSRGLAAVAFVAAAGLFVLYALLDRAALAGWAAHPLTDRWFGQLLEFEPLVRVLEGDYSAARLHQYTGFVVYAMPIALVGVLLCKWIPPLSRWVLALLALAIIPLGVWQVRWMLHAELVWATALPIGFASLLARVPLPFGSFHARKRAVATAASLVVALLLFAPSLKRYYVNYAFSPLLPRETSRAQQNAALADQLRAHTDSTPPRQANAILADWTSGPALLWFADMRVVAAPYHRDLAGIEAACAYYTAEDPAAALEIIRKFGVRYVVVPELPQFNQADMELLLFGELRSFDEARSLNDVGEINRRLQVRDDAPVSMLARLYAGELSDVPWLTPVVSRPVDTGGPTPAVQHVVYEVTDAR